MKCDKCNCVLDKHMNFCPICGNQVGEAAVIVNSHENKKKIEKLYAEKEYDQILDFAMAGDNIAKCYYMEYIWEQATKGYFYDWDSIFEKLISAKNAGNGFAIAAYGIFQYEHAKKGALGVSDTVTMESAYKLVEKATNMNEPAAMTEFGCWLCDGTDYVKKDEYRGYQLIKQSADMGYPKAIRILGYWHYNGNKNISEDEELGFQLIERAAFMGEYSASYIISEVNPNWLDEDFSFSILPQAIEHITQTIVSEEKIAFPQKSDEEEDKQHLEVFCLLKNCKSLEDYKSLYKQLEENHDAASKDIQTHLSIIRKIVILLSGVSGAEKVKNDKEKAVSLLNQYTELQDFLHFKEDLNRLELSFDETNMLNLMTEASELIVAKSKVECEDYLSYVGSMYIKNSIKKDIIKKAFWAIAALIASCFSIMIGVIIGIISFFKWIGLIRSQRHARKELLSTEENFLLINRLMRYGYKINKLETYYEYASYVIQ